MSIANWCSTVHKRKIWIRVDDIVLVSPWDFRSDRADIIWRYITAHADRLQERLAYLLALSIRLLYQNKFYKNVYFSSHLDLILRYFLFYCTSLTGIHVTE
ncbi:MAG TPA: hypothetical protein VE548_16345 [Nitrososphaeraceae archaeon]|nr:hypothetical protein [Nitrososphaeraceae archaeon]